MNKKNKIYRTLKTAQKPSGIFLAVQDGGGGSWSLHEYPNAQAVLEDVQEGNRLYGNKWKILKEVFIEATEESPKKTCSEFVKRKR